MNAHVAVGIRGSRSTTRPTPRLFAGRIAATLRELSVCPSGSHRRGAAALLTVPHVSLLYEYLGIQFVVITCLRAQTTRKWDGPTWSLLSRRMVCCDAKKAEVGSWLGR